MRILRTKFGSRKQISFQRMDIKRAFRQVVVAPDRAAVFAYRLNDLIFEDLRLQFGWHGNPEWWGVVASAIDEAHRATTWASLGTSATAKEGTRYVGFVGPTGKAVEPLTPGYRVPRVQGG